MLVEELDKFLSDLGFSTKEDLDKIKSSPEMLRYLNAVQAGVTKKFQGSASERAQIEGMLQKAQSEIQQYVGALTEWEDWAQQNADFLATYDKFQTSKQRRGRQPNDQTPSELEEKLDRLMAALERGQQELLSVNKKYGQLERMFNLQMQLSDLRLENPKLDVNKLLDVAQKKGYSDLRKAYLDEDAYGKEILDKKASELADVKFKEELAKRGTNLETGSGSVPTHFELPKMEQPGTPTKPSTSFESLGLEFLKERQSEGAKPNP